MTSPPRDLILAFRAAEQPQHLAPLMVDDEERGRRGGFDAIAMRIVGSWEHAQHRWRAPRTPCPDDGKPTPRAWSWLWSGHHVDIDEIARGADVALEIAREKINVLRHNRLIYPDGSLSQWLLAAVRTHVSKRLGVNERRGGSGN